MAGPGRVFVCYVPGCDLRRLGPAQTPYIARLLRDFPWAKARTYPSPEQLSTLITGQRPHGHGMWQAQLRPARPRSALERLIDLLPDWLTTTGQCALHQLTRRFDVPTVAPRRRRWMEFHRLKFYGRADTGRLGRALGARPSLVSALGPAFRYRFTDAWEDREAVLRQGVGDGARLDLLQFHALDVAGHWALEAAEDFRTYYGGVDALVRDLHAQCERAGVTMVLLSDHGQEQVRESVDLRPWLRQLDLPPEECLYYLQPITLRFWCRTERVRRAVAGLLKALPHGTALTYQDLRRYQIAFEDPAHGAFYFIADPGWLFFPHDFHHPLVNVLFGLRHPQQRRRLRDPRHLAYHGYLPHHASEQGFMAVLDRTRQVRTPEIDLADVAPSLLRLLGEAVPTFMHGEARFA